LIGGEKMLNLFEGDVRDVRFLERVSQEVPELDFVVLNAGVGYF
jgi:hypothetical protein